MKNIIKMANKKGIGYSPIGDKIYLGTQNVEKRMWTGKKEDITSEFIAVSLLFYEEGTIRDIGGSNGSSNLLINIKNDKESIEKLIRNLEKRLIKNDK